MHYYEWNNLIGGLLFNPTRAGQQVLLYLTKEQITQTAVNEGHFETEEEAWDCFTRRLRGWFGRDKHLTDCINDALGRSQRITIAGKTYETDYPVCLSLLILSVLPLTDSNQAFVTQADYYKRAEAYAEQNNLPRIVQQKENANWNDAWAHIQTWSIQIKKVTWGYFQLNNSFGHIYVGKPFSQCLIPLHTLRDLPRAFVRAGWVPRQALSESDWHHLLQNYCYDLGVRQAALKTLLTGEGLAYALPILEERFNYWDGTIYTSAESQTQLPSPNRSGIIRSQKINKEETYARFYLTFLNLDETDGRFCWQYRIKGNQPLPDVLQLAGHEFVGQLNNWSNGVGIPFQESLHGYDPSNKWRVKWPDADIRLFENGQWHGLSRRIWVETNELSRINRMYAICKPGLKQTLRQWGTTSGFFKELTPDDFDAAGWPVDYGLFEFDRPTQGITGTRFVLPTAKQAEWHGGLKISYGCYFNRHLPQLQIINGEGNESVSAFTESGQQIALSQNLDNPTFYELVGELPDKQPIICRVAGQSVSITGQFTGADIVIFQNEYPRLPARNAFGDILTNKASAIFSGLDTGQPQICPYKHVFYPKREENKLPFQLRNDHLSFGDDLLAYLTCRRASRPTDYFTAYETILTQIVDLVDLPLNISKSRRWALGWYDALGYVDYDYESGRILIQPPTLIPVPCALGHRAILIGGRSLELINRLRQVAESLGVLISVENQSEQSYLAPSVISLYTEESFYSKEYSPIYKVAKQLGVPFFANELTTWRFLERSGSLIDYRKTLQPESEAETATWTLRIFNPDRLRFERHTHGPFDTSFTLVERQLNAYQFVHYLWIDSQSFRVDKNWGRFLVLHYHQKQVIFRREQYNQIAIPATLPLPRVLARGFSLLSGKIPLKQTHDFDGVNRAYLLYENAGNILSDNYIQKLGQQIQTTQH